MKKRLVALFIAGMLSVSMLAGCGNQSTDSVQNESEETEITDENGALEVMEENSKIVERNFEGTVIADVTEDRKSFWLSMGTDIDEYYIPFKGYVVDYTHSTTYQSGSDTYVVYDVDCAAYRLNYWTSTGLSCVGYNNFYLKSEDISQIMEIDDKYIVYFADGSVKVFEGKKISEDCAQDKIDDTLANFHTIVAKYGTDTYYIDYKIKDNMSLDEFIEANKDSLNPDKQSIRITDQITFIIRVDDNGTMERIESDNYLAINMNRQNEVVLKMSINQGIDFTDYYDAGNGEYAIEMAYNAGIPIAEELINEDDKTSNGDAVEWAPEDAGTTAVSGVNDEIFQKYKDSIDPSDIFESNECFFVDVDGNGTPELIAYLGNRIPLMYYINSEGNVEQDGITGLIEGGGKTCCNYSEGDGWGVSFSRLENGQLISEYSIYIGGDIMNPTLANYYHDGVCDEVSEQEAESLSNTDAYTDLWNYTSYSSLLDAWEAYNN